MKSERGGAGVPSAVPAMPDSEERVVLLDRAGNRIGTSTKAAVHTRHTPRHLAFSCYLFDAAGRVLLTRRALGKATWPGVWTNTCCGHPLPDESPRDAVVRRLGQELGARASDLRLALPEFAYRAVDSSGIVEDELCPVWVGRLVPAPLTPDPAEVMDWTWVQWSDLAELAERAPTLLSPWSVLQVTAMARMAGLQEVLA